MKRSADISEDGRLRWTLTREWRRETGSALFVMLNPSTADAEKDDPTIRNIIDRAYNWGFGKLVVVNLFPIRSSSPDAAFAWMQTVGSNADAEGNERIIRDEARKAGIVICAWGGTHWAQAKGQRMWSMLRSLDVETFCIGRTKNGYPKHPLARGRHRVPVNTHYQPWRPWEEEYDG